MNLKLTVEQIAKVAHEVNREYAKVIGDPVKPGWEEAPEDQRVSVTKGVEYHLGNPDSKPSDSHGAWLQHKLAAGWKYGEKIDPIAMTHPCMVPYDRLPVEQQAKDFIFIAIVRQLSVLEIKAGFLSIPANPDQEAAIKMLPGVNDFMAEVKSKMEALIGSDTKVDLTEPIVGKVDIE